MHCMDAAYLIGRHAGVTAGRQIIERGPQTVDICPGIGLSHTAELLRGGIAPCTQTDGIPRFAGFIDTHRAEIDQCKTAIGPQQDISRLHVTVDIISLMQIAQHIA